MNLYNKVFLFFVFMSVSLGASDNVGELIDNQEHFAKQKEVFENLEQKQDTVIQRYDIQKPELLEVKDENCFVIKSIKDEGITLLTNKEKKSLYKEYIGKCTTVTELNNLTRKLTAIYMDKGYITSQLYIKPQDISQGEVVLSVIEGKIKNINPDERYINSAFIGQKGKYLNIRNLENAIETINRLESNHAKMDLVPSDEVGYTDINIENNTTSRINGQVGINNFGTKKTGDKQGTLVLNLDNPLGVNDKFTININSTDKHYQDENSIGNGYEYAIPFERLLTTFSYRESKYKQFVSGGINKYTSRGNTKTYTFGLNYNLFHNQSHKVTIGSNISQYRARNFFNDILIETSSYDLSKITTMIDYTYQNTGFYSYIGFGYTKGTDWFNAHNSTVLNEKYSLYTIDLSATKRFEPFAYSLSGHYQHGNNQLFSTNQISIGGHYSVRGYQKEGLSGNSGFYVRNELSLHPTVKLFDSVEQSYFVGFDYGKIQKEKDTDGGKLYSNVVGVKFKKDKLDMSVYYATPLAKKDVSKSEKFCGFSVSYRF